MSLVGTRPPTLDEWEKYEPHHRAKVLLVSWYIFTHNDSPSTAVIRSHNHNMII